MGSVFKFLALVLFAAGGVAVAMALATLLPETGSGNAPASPIAAAVVQRAATAPESPSPEVGPTTAAAEATLNSPGIEPPHGEFAAQISPPPQASPNKSAEKPLISLAQNDQTPEIPGLGDIGKAVLQEVLKQQVPLDNLEKQREQNGAGNQSAPPIPHPPGEDEEEGESTGAPGTSPQQQRTAAPLPSEFKVTKVPGEGDDRLSVHIQNKDLREVLDFLGEHGDLSILASPSVQGLVSVSLTDVTIDQALSAILKSTGYTCRREGKFVYVGTPQDIQSMVQSVDRIETRVYRPNYVKAADLQPLVTPLLSPAGSATAGSSTVAVSPPAQVGITPDDTQAGGDSFAEGEVLVVRDYIAVLDEIDQVVAEIDKRPMQVAIEAMLLSVELNDSNTFGVDWQFLRDKEHIRFAAGSPPASLGNVTFTQGGLKFGFLDSSLGVFVAALQTIGDTNVIASPRLMCLNKQKAEILIGQQLGYVTKTLTQTTTAQTVEFLEVGTQLRLRPFISTDGLIRMEVHPELSTGSVEVKEGFTLPNKQTTQVTTNIMVRDGCTVVIGGLMQETLGNTGNQVPLIGSAPGIGFLFRTRTGTQKRNEIIVLITPHIVYEPEACIEGDQAAADFHRQHAVYKDEFVPLNSRYVGRKFFRLAQRAWANGEKKPALRFINMAIHFDPQNRAAVDLRADILANNQWGRQSGITPLPVGPPTQALDGEAIAPWLLDDLEQGAVGGYEAPHPRDPGAPERVIRVVPGSEFR
ncbi:MAG: secretin and TonB N-terminal domain-containing protein [Pirellulales bacterium]